MPGGQVVAGVDTGRKRGQADQRNRAGQRNAGGQGLGGALKGVQIQGGVETLDQQGFGQTDGNLVGVQGNFAVEDRLRQFGAVREDSPIAVDSEQSEILIVRYSVASHRMGPDGQRIHRRQDKRGFAADAVDVFVPVKAVDAEFRLNLGGVDPLDGKADPVVAVLNVEIPVAHDFAVNEGKTADRIGYEKPAGQVCLGIDIVAGDLMVR